MEFLITRRSQWNFMLNAFNPVQIHNEYVAFHFCVAHHCATWETIDPSIQFMVSSLASRAPTTFPRLTTSRSYPYKKLNKLYTILWEWDTRRLFKCNSLAIGCNKMHTNVACRHHQLLRAIKVPSIVWEWCKKKCTNYHTNINSISLRVSFHQIEIFRPLCCYHLGQQHTICFICFMLRLYRWNSLVKIQIVTDASCW